jgi:hypothetical protein
MDDKRFDKRLKDLLDGHREDVPDGMWDRVAPAERKRRRAVAWWAYASLLVFLAGGLGYTGYRWSVRPTGETTAILPQPATQPPAATPSPEGASATEATAVEQPSPLLSAENVPAATASGSGSGTGSAYADGQTGAQALVTTQLPVREPDRQPQGDVAPTDGSAHSSSWVSLPMLHALLPDGGWYAFTPWPRPETIQLPDPEDTQPQPAVSPRGLSIEFLIAPELPFKRLSGHDAHYKNIREESELHYSAYSMSLYMHARFERFFLRAGIQYSRIYERLSVEITDGYISQVLVDTLLKGFILDPFQSTQPYALVDTTFSYTYNEFQHRDRNRYTFVNVPVAAGYTLASSKFDLYATAGLSLNLAHRAEGLIIAPDSVHLLMLDDKKTTPFRTQAGLSATASMGLAYRLYPKLTFLFEPSYRTHLMSITRDAHPLRQKYGVIGVNVGLRMDF